MSTTINPEMKMACAMALAELARSDVPEEVKKVYPGRDFTFGKNYVIPTPFDPRLITVLPIAVAKAAMKSGAARVQIEDFEKYAEELKKRVGQ